MAEYNLDEPDLVSKKESDSAVTSIKKQKMPTWNNFFLLGLACFIVFSLFAIVLDRQISEKNAQEIQREILVNHEKEARAEKARKFDEAERQKKRLNALKKDLYLVVKQLRTKAAQLNRNPDVSFTGKSLKYFCDKHAELELERAFLKEYDAGIVSSLLVLGQLKHQKEIWQITERSYREVSWVHTRKDIYDLANRFEDVANEIEVNLER